MQCIVAERDRDVTRSVGVEKGDCAKLLQLPGGQHVTGLNTTQGGKSGGRRKSGGKHNASRV